MRLLLGFCGLVLVACGSEAGMGDSPLPDVFPACNNGSFTAKALSQSTIDG